MWTSLHELDQSCPLLVYINVSSFSCKYNSSQFRISTFYGGQKNIFSNKKFHSYLGHYRITTNHMAQGFKPIMNEITFYKKYILIAIIVTHKV
jgi:hypothetical protein